MFRASLKSLNLISSLLKQPTKVILDTKNCRAAVKLPECFIQKQFYSKDAKPVDPSKISLQSILAKEVAKATEQPETTISQQETAESREQSWRRMKLTLIIFGVSFTCLGLYLIIELGRPELEDDGRETVDKWTSMPLYKQYVLRTLSKLRYYRQLIEEPSRDKLLPDMIKLPYYSPKYTLVLEFTDVIVHPEWTYQTGWRFKKRPYLDHFLETLSGSFEIVIYTAEQGMTVFPIVEALDPKNHVTYKLVRDATLFIDGKHVKDLDKLNRNLEKTIVVDWDGDSSKYHPENVFKIPRWKGDDSDMTLFHLASFLTALSQNEIDDIREVIKYYNQFDDPLATFREKQKSLIDLAEEAAAKTANTPQAPAAKWTPSFLRRHS